MNNEKMLRMSHDLGFIAALDQSGGSTPKALALYGVTKEAYSTEEEMFNQVHKMRARIIQSSAFTGEKVLAAILFQGTMERKIAGKLTADYLWETKNILSFLKIDQGLADEANGVQLLKPIPDLAESLQNANKHHVFGTKERSLIKLANRKGINDVVKQQFELAKEVAAAGLVPIVEPEVDIHSSEKAQAERLLKTALIDELATLEGHVKIILKLSLPTEPNFYQELLSNPHIIRIVALSGGHSRSLANELLAENHGIVASFSRALSEGLNVKQSQTEFDELLNTAVTSIYNASIK